MSQKERISIILDAEMEVNKIKSAVGSISSALSSLTLPKGLGSELEKRMNNLNEEIRNFQALASKAGDSLENATKIDSSYKKILKYSQQVQNSFAKISEEAGIDPNKFFPKELVSRISKAEEAMEQYNKSIDDGKKKIKEQIAEADRLAKKIKDKTTTKSDLETKQSAKKTALSSAKATKKTVDEEQTKIKTQATAKQADINKEIALLEKEKKAIQELEKARTALANAELKQKTAAARAGTKESTNKDNAAEVKVYIENVKKAEAAAAEYTGTVRSLTEVDFALEQQNAAFKEQESVIKDAESAMRSAEGAVKKAQTAYDNASQKVAENNAEIQETENKYKKLTDTIEQSNNTVKNNAFSELAEKLKEIDIIIDPTTTSLEEIQTIINNLKPEAINQMTESLKKAGIATDQLEQGTDELGDKNRVYQDMADDVKRANTEMEQIKHRVQDFFSLTNSIVLFRRAVQQAFETVKELDAAMTETAVVTDFSVGDMWDQLPRYTQAANDLGTTTLGAYETMTLFYQQGLETNEVFEIGTETMKMARIAGLEYKDATDLMTAALRGFNMELNEASAARVNDVYSELAAITAADTQEIATAMTKTASIAANANMEFETTAAFLSQIIETTREPAETAGTAMKTIIARFTEMKKSSEEVFNVDGEEVNVNKVEAALKSAGVALRDLNGEFRDTDDVFLELASKWDSLDKMTQRYIATTAAGSRQQSRFIAMMSNYDRTVELVDAAYNSAGASQTQFGKTQESLESKLNKLKNAWDEFVMGITNSKAIKVGVDLLTKLLNIVNKLTGSSGIAKLGVAILGLKGGGAIFNSLLKSFSPLVKNLNGEGEKAATGFITGLTQRLNNFKAGKPFVLDADVNTKGISNKFNQIKANWLDLGRAFKEPLVPSETIIGFQTLDKQMIITSMTAEGATESIEFGLSEIGTKAIVTAAAADGIGDELEESGVTGTFAMKVLEEQIEDLNKDLALAKWLGDDVGAANIEVDIKNFSKDLDKLKGANSKAIAKETKTLGGSLKNVFAKGISGAKGFLSALAPIAPMLALIAVEIGVIWAAWYFSPENVLKRQIEDTTKVADGLSEVLDSARTSLQNLNNEKSGLQTLKEEMDALVVGTDEWRLKLLEVQAEEAKLINKYDLGSIEGGKYISTNASGVQEIKDSGWEYLENKQEETIRRTSAAQTISGAQLLKQQQELDKIQQLNNKEDVEAKYADEIAGAITFVGMGLIATIGAVMFPPAAPVTYAIATLGASAIGAKIVEDVAEDTWGHTKEYYDLEKDLDYQERIAEQQKYMQYKSAISTKLAENEDYDEYELNVISSVSAASMDQLIENEEKELGIGFFMTDGANKDEIAEWAEYAGYTVKDDKVYDSEGNEIDTKDNETINKELAIYRALEKAEASAETIADNLAVGGKALENLGIDKAEYEDFAKIMSGDITANKEAVEALASDQTKRDELTAEMLANKTEQEKIELISAYTGQSAEKIEGKDYNKLLSQHIEKMALETQLSQVYAQKDFFTEMALSGFAKTNVGPGYSEDFSFSSGITLDQVRGFYNKLNTEQIQSITNISKNLRESLGMQGKAAQIFQENIVGMNPKDLEQTLDIFSGVDFSNPIRGAQALRKAADSGKSSIQKLGAEIEAASGTTYDLGNQFNYLISSGAFDSFSEDIEDIIEDTGRISAKNIEDMAESSEELAIFLENDAISAHGLAQAFTLVAKGEDIIDGITTATLTAISTTRTLANTYEELKDETENWEPAIDSMLGMDAIDESIEAMQDMFDNFEYGNPALWSYIKRYFDVEIDSIDTMKKYFNLLKSYNKNDGVNFWNSYVGSKGIQDEDGNTILSTAGGVFNLADGVTTEQLLERLQEQYSLTEHAAKSLISTLSTHSFDFSQQLNNNDAKKAIQSLFQQTAIRSGRYDEENNQYNTADYISASNIIAENEVRVIAETYGKTYEEVVEELNSEAQKQKIPLIIVPKLEDENGNPLTGKKLYEQLQSYGGKKGISAFITETKQGNVDYEKTKEVLLSVGLDEQQSNYIVDQYIKDNSEKSIDFKGQLYGSTEAVNNFISQAAQAITTDSLNQLIKATAEAISGANFDDLIKEIQHQINKYTFTGKLTLTIEKIINWFSGKGFIDNYTYDAVQSDVVANQINGKDPLFAPNNAAPVKPGYTLTPNGKIPEYDPINNRWIYPLAKGSSGLPCDQVALTGEEGAELVESKNGTAHLVGVGGPEVTNLKKGDKVYTASQTKKILRGRSPKSLFKAYKKGTGEKTFPRYEGGYYTPYDDGGTGGNSNTNNDKLKDIDINVTINIDAELEALERQREKGEIDALKYQEKRNLLLSKKWETLYDEFSRQLANSSEKQYIYYDQELDTLKLTDAYENLSDERKEEVLEEYEKLKDINDELNEIEDTVGKIGTKINSLKNTETALDAIDRKYKNKELSAVDYQFAREAMLQKRATLLQENLDNELATNAEKDFFYYDKELDEILLREDLLAQLTDEELVKEVEQEYENVKKINDELNKIEDELKDVEFATPEDEQRYYAAEARNISSQNELEKIERNRTMTDRYRDVVGKLPEEIQGPLNLVFTGADAMFGLQEMYQYADIKANMEDELLSKWNSSVNKDYYIWDPNTQSLALDEEKYSNPELSDKTREDIKKEFDELAGYVKTWKEASDKIDGGPFQDAVKVAAKTLKQFSKEVGDNDFKDGLVEVNTGFEKLDEALNNFIDGLEENEKIDEFLSKKIIPGLGWGEEEYNKITSNKSLTKFLEQSGLGVLLADIGWGEGLSVGQLAGFGANAFGGLLETITPFMNPETIGFGLDIVNGVKGMADQISSKIEEFVGYITQATQVIIDAWTNREDYLYNFLKIIEKHLQEYENLQREDNQFQKGRTASVEDIKRNWNEQWKSLQTQLEEQQERLETRQQELNRSRWNPFQLISGWDPTSDTLYENREVKFLWDVIIGLGEAFAPFGTGAFFSQLNQLYEDYDERVQNSYEDRLAAEQAILDIEDQRLELVKAGAEEATQFEQKVLEALIQKEQEQIDELTRLNESITEANSKLISTLQNNLEKIRQDRENEKKEEELGEKERRLAYLRQDTSGANMMEIKKLEEELEEGHEDYTDTLIDQKISELQEQNDKAAEQRQQQIELLQAQLDWNEKYGLYWDTIYGMLYTFDENGNVILKPENFDIDGNIRENSELAKMLGTFSDRIGMSTWSAVLDSEELKLLGRYYGAFVGVNGVDGNWKNRWALNDPGADDPNYAYPEQEIPEGVWGVLYSMEIMFKKYFVNSNLGIANGIGRVDEAFKNAFGKLFGNEELANYNFEGYKAEQVQSTFFAGLKKAGDDAAEWFAKAFSKNSNNAKSFALNAGGNQNYGDTNINNTFTIGTVGESVSLDDMVDKVSNAIKGMFTSPINSLQKSR